MFYLTYVEKKGMHKSIMSVMAICLYNDVDIIIWFISTHFIPVYTVHLLEIYHDRKQQSFNCLFNRFYFLKLLYVYLSSLITRSRLSIYPETFYIHYSLDI